MTRRTVEERFWAKVQKTDTCWLWTASLNTNGYGQFNNGTTMVRSHRLAYEWLQGPIPEGLCLDHLCRVRNCVNPDHLEPVTQGENVRRGLAGDRHQAAKTHCPQGHPYDEANTYRPARGERLCRTCNRAASRRWRARRKALAS